VKRSRGEAYASRKDRGVPPGRGILENKEIE